MKGARGWVIAGAIAIVIAVAAVLLQPRQDSPEHSTDSDAANGASAALLFSQAMGHPTDQITGSFGAPAERSVMFVFTPTSPYTADEADRIHQWVLASGGILIYASEQADPELDRAFGDVVYGLLQILRNLIEEFMQTDEVRPLYILVRLFRL